jgi:hypothetical protein
MRGVAGMLKYVSKFTMDILPSVVATIIGAYIVNHYIATKPGADAPVAAAVSSADPKKPDAADVANIPEPGVRAKGFAEKTSIERAAVVEKPADRPVEKSADKPAETASIPADTRRHPAAPAPREKTAARTVPAPVQPVISAAVPVVAAPNPPPPVEAAAAPEEHRDVNDLARAAIERLRGTGDSSPRAQEAARTPDAGRIPDTGRIGDVPRVASAPSVPAPQVRPLPPPIMVSTPAGDAFATGSVPARPPYAAARIDDPMRPTPPADIPDSIPASRPLDLHADAVDPPVRAHTTVAEDMLSAAKSVFHAVLPNNSPK